MAETTPKEFVFDADQVEAVNACLDKDQRLVAVTGPAGTGKTSIMQTDFNTLVEAGYRVALCAPTGRAAKRIKELTGIGASTIHRLLEYPRPGQQNPNTGKFLVPSEPQRCRKYPLEYDFVFADEYAMVTHEVHRNLIAALPTGGCLRMFGDLNQLRPVEMNKRVRLMDSPFQDMISRFKAIELSTIHRQGEGSGIVQNGGLINRGRIPQRLDDFAIKITQKPLDVITDIVMEGREEGIDYATINHQIMSPTNIGWTGVHKLNALIQQLVRPERDGWLTLPRHKWAKDMGIRIHVGDKVIWTENDYLMDDGNGVFNGETGVVTEITDYEEIEIDFGDRLVLIPPVQPTVDRNGRDTSYDPRRSLSLAYCVTTHKAQGSEFRHVVYVLNRSSLRLQNRNNFYTAITRARDHVTLVTDQVSLSASVRKERIR